MHLPCGMNALRSRLRFLADESGAYLIPGVLIVTMVTLLAFVMGRELLFVDSKQMRGQISADAAARAGAVTYLEGYRTAFSASCGATADLTELSSTLLTAINAQLGGPEAYAIARENRAALTRYRVDVADTPAVIGGINIPLPEISALTTLSHTVPLASDICDADGSNCREELTQINRSATAMVVPIDGGLCTTADGDVVPRIDWEIQLSK